MSRQITLGSRADNDFSYQNPSVSGYHAVLKIENNVVIIEDLNSTNGTYINDKPVKEAILKAHDKLELGVFEVPVGELFKKINEHELLHKTDFSKEYEAMLSNFKIYRKKKIVISTPPKWPIILRVTLTILLITVWLMTDTIPRQYLFILTLLIGLTAVLPSLFMGSATLRNERLDDLKNEYESMLSCPKCKASMINNSLSNWETRERCPNEKCDVIFKNKNKA
ncbi:MAG: FHA domain-containing protein [Saprospiraceae bacterium]